MADEAYVIPAGDETVIIEKIKVCDEKQDAVTIDRSSSSAEATVALKWRDGCGTGAMNV